MSASEKLKVIEAEEFAAPWLYDQPVEGDFRNALPQIVAVVKAAEHPYFWPPGFEPEPGAPWGDLRAALAALDEALP